MENDRELKRKVAALESHLDQTESELSYLNALLLSCGFPGGVTTLKKAIEQLLSEPDIDEDRQPPFLFE